MADILFERRGAAGVVILDRPRALNAVSRTMVRDLAKALADWAVDDAVTRVVVTAAGERVFSAGGDLRELYELGRVGREAEVVDYWRDEYRLNAFIKHYRKPYVALIDGVVMGGGVGISIHGSHRVAGDHFRFAMPEVGIGFFPDVGASWFLPRLPREIGIYCALTGENLDAADGVASGVATHRVRSSHFPALLEALCGRISVDAVINAFAEPPSLPPASVMTRSEWIASLFGGARVEDILMGLDSAAAEEGIHGSLAAAATALIRTKSPMSLKVTRALLSRGRMLDFDACMRLEFRVASRFAEEHDLYEGIRSVIIDKDRNPRWRPSSLAEIGDRDVDGYFLPVPLELDFA